MRNTLIFFLLLQSSMLFAQPGEVPTVDIDGEKFHVHQVEAGNTLWGLKLMYGVEVEEIVKLNPELKDGLKIGQKINIPFIVTEEIDIPLDSEIKKKFYKYVVGYISYIKGNDPFIFPVIRRSMVQTHRDRIQSPVQ